MIWFFLFLFTVLPAFHNNPVNKTSVIYVVLYGHGNLMIHIPIPPNWFGDKNQ